MELNLKKMLIAVVLVLVSVISMLPLGDLFTKQETFQDTSVSIDSKIDTVLKLTAASTVASGLVSAIPDDTATPIAAELAEFAEYFLLILCVLYAEKYLMTIIGAGFFRILIPVVCLLFILGLFLDHKVTRRLALKIGAVGLAFFLVVPISIRVSDVVYATYSESIDSTISSAENFSTDPGSLTEQSGGSLLDKITGTAANLTARAAQIMNNFVQSLALMIVTSCLIPLVVLLFFLWLIKMLTGVDISLPAANHHKRFRKLQGK